MLVATGRAPYTQVRAPSAEPTTIIITVSICACDCSSTVTFTSTIVGMSLLAFIHVPYHYFHCYCKVHRELSNQLYCLLLGQSYGGRRQSLLTGGRGESVTYYFRLVLILICSILKCKVPRKSAIVSSKKLTIGAYEAAAVSCARTCAHAPNSPIGSRWPQ